MKIGIIGIGRMGKNHLRVLCSLRKQIAEISIYDTDIETLKDMAKIYDVSYYTDLDNFFANVDSVIICSPTTTHYELAKLAAAKNKDMLIEKPITATTDEAIDLVNLIKKKNIICMVGHIERYNPVIIHLLEYIKDKNIFSIEARRISKIERDRAFNVDVVTDLMIHDIDIILTITNSMPIKINAVSSNENLDEVFSTMQFNNGLICYLASSRISQKKIRELCISLENENIYVDYIKNKIDIVSNEDITIPISSNSSYKRTGSEKTIYFEGEPLKIELQSFLECVRNRTKPLSNEDTGFRALVIAKEVVGNIIAK